MQKINSVKMVYFQPSVDERLFLKNNLLSQKKDHYLNFSALNSFRPAKNINSRSIWNDIVHFVHKDVSFKIGRVEHRIPMGQLISTTCFLCAGLLLLYMI